MEAKSTKCSYYCEKDMENYRKSFEAKKALLLFADTSWITCHIFDKIYTGYSRKNSEKIKYYHVNIKRKRNRYFNSILYEIHH